MKLPKLRRNGDGRAFAVAPRTGGRRTYFGQYGTPEAETEYRLWLAGVLSGNPAFCSEPQQHVPTIQELTSQYVAWLTAEREKGCREISLAANAGAHLCRLAGTVTADQVGPRMLLLLQADLAQRTYTRHSVSRLYSRQHIRKVIAEIKRMVRWACTREILPPEQFSRLAALTGLKRGKARETEPVRPVPLETLTATLPFLRQPYRSMALIQFYCGMRPGEVCGLRWDCIQQTGEGVIYSPLSHKTAYRNKNLIKAVPLAAQKLLEQIQREDPVYVFPAPISPGKNVSIYSYEHAIGRAIQRARKTGLTLEDWRPNQLRHAIATEIRQRFGMESAQNYLGHAKVDITHTYAERTTACVVEIANRLDETLFRELNLNSSNNTVATGSTKP